MKSTKHTFERASTTDWKNEKYLGAWIQVFKKTRVRRREMRNEESLGDLWDQDVRDVSMTGFPEKGNDTARTREAERLLIANPKENKNSRARFMRGFPTMHQNAWYQLITTREYFLHRNRCILQFCLAWTFWGFLPCKTSKGFLHQWRRKTLQSKRELRAFIGPTMMKSERNCKRRHTQHWTPQTQKGNVRSKHSDRLQYSKSWKL